MTFASRRAISAAFILVLLVAGCAATPTADPVPTEQSQVPRLTPEEVRGLVNEGQQVVIVDTRSRASYDERHIPGALSIPMVEIEERSTELPRDKLIVLYCT